MEQEKWKYTWGAASTGNADCSGAFVWSFRRHGASIPHGSNAIARFHVGQLLPPSAAEPGMAAFKFREPGQRGYALPDKYKNSGDLRDYYHIGLVDEDPAWVLNAQSVKTGFVRSRISSGWHCVARLNAVDYSGMEADCMENMVVTCAEGETVRLRKGPSTSAGYLAKLPNGTEVEAGAADNGWRPVQWKDHRGYMLDAFLRAADAADPGGVVTVSLPYDAAIALRDALNGALGLG